MKLAAIIGGVCAVCSVSPHEHEPCGTCEGSIQQLKLCAFCNAWLKKNPTVAWNRKRFDNADDFDDGTDDGADDELADSGELTGNGELYAARVMRDVQKPPRARGRPRCPRIDDEVLPRLLRRRVRVTVPRFDQYGRSRGTYEVWRWSSRRQIAREAGCSHASVDRRYHDYTRAKSRNPRASCARRIT